MKKTDLKNMIIKLLERGWNISHICSELGISRQTYYNRQQNDGKFNQRTQTAQTMIELKSKEVIFDAVNNGDLSVAKRYLDKFSSKDGFSSQNESFDKILDDIMDDENAILQ